MDIPDESKRGDHTKEQEREPKQQPLLLDKSGIIAQ